MGYEEPRGTLKAAEPGKRLEGRVAIVTGAASGIGAATVAMFLREGASVLATDVRDIDDDLLGTAGARAIAVRHDVASEREWRNVMIRAGDDHDGLDILVNCAGINTPGGGVPENQDIENVSMDDFRAVYAVNVEGTLLGCKQAIPIMAGSGGGTIVNVSSVAGWVGVPGAVSYGASKAAIWQITKSIALHCARAGNNIRCNSIHPGGIHTPMFVPMIGDGLRDSPEALHVPMGRYGEPREVAEAILFLAGDDSTYITGSSLPVDGGLTVT
jgi:NAD(P)-dependent dehydrogenase (short-subunit alcohol dehydrogenase family)